MNKTVIKRDGKKVKFQLDKIREAIVKSNIKNNEMTDEDILKVVNIVKNKIEKLKDEITVETIQDIVEDTLMKNHFYKTAKSYILYRDERTRIRQGKTKLLQEVGKKIKAVNVVNQNANVDEMSFGGRKGEADNILMKQYALDYCMSKLSRENHLNNEIYIHDLDSYAVGSHNCLSIPFDELLAKGFNTRQTDVRPAGSVSTAMQLVAVIFQLQSLQQFGGVSATHLDWTMVPYVRKSFFKHYEEGLKWLDSTYKYSYNNKMSIDDENYKKNDKVYKYALERTSQELNQAVEGLYHNLNTLQSRSGNQLPFTSINYGTCTLPEGRMVIKALLEGSIKGVGKVHKTPIFPCGIFQYMKGVNDKEGTPNYDLFKLALESTSKRLYPNYANVDWSNNAGYDRKDPRTYFSTMGALDADEFLYVKFGKEKPKVLSIKELFDYCKKENLNKYRSADLYINKPYLNEQKDADKAKRRKILNLPGVYSITYLPEDVTYIGSSSSILRKYNEFIKAVENNKKVNKDIDFNDSNIDHYKFEILETNRDYEDLENKYVEKVAEKLSNYQSDTTKYMNYKREKIYYRPLYNFDLSYSQYLINLEDFDIKVLDKGNKWVKIKHIFKNDKRNTPLMLNIFYINENNIVRLLKCTEDHPLWTGKKFVRAIDLVSGDKLYDKDNKELEIIDISFYNEPVDSYDIGTVTGSFIGSNIIMHNCRTANGYDINAEPGQNPQIKDGRGNICPVTIILPTLAMEANRDVESFITLLDKKIHEAKDMLIERFNYICEQSPESAKFMYENNIMLGYKPEEGIRSALKHGTLAVGQLGLAETLELLVGCNQTKEEGMKLAKRIEQLFKDRCAEFKEKYKLNFGVYYSPAESLCFTAMNKFKEKYGVIPKVSDKEYFTNSIHIPVYEKVNAFEKIDLESQLTGYSTAGCITYIELDSAIQGNLEALETIVTYAMNKDIPYFAVNVPCDECLDCGYSGEFNDKCPECGSYKIRQLRRVTGYLSGTWKNFNYGKQCEVMDRVKHI